MYAIIVNYRDDIFQPQGVALVNDDELADTLQRISNTDTNKLFDVKTLKVDSALDLIGFIHNQNQ